MEKTRILILLSEALIYQRLSLKMLCEFISKLKWNFGVVMYDAFYTNEICDIKKNLELSRWLVNVWGENNLSAAAIDASKFNAIEIKSNKISVSQKQWEKYNLLPWIILPPLVKHKNNVKEVNILDLFTALHELSSFNKVLVLDNALHIKAKQNNLLQNKMITPPNIFQTWKIPIYLYDTSK